MSNEDSLCCCEPYHHLPIGPVNTNLSNITNYFWRTQITFTLQSLFKLCVFFITFLLFPSYFLFFPTSSKNIWIVYPQIFQNQVHLK